MRAKPSDGLAEFEDDFNALRASLRLEDADDVAQGLRKVKLDRRDLELGELDLRERKTGQRGARESPTPEPT